MEHTLAEAVDKLIGVVESLTERLLALEQKVAMVEEAHNIGYPTPADLGARN